MNKYLILLSLIGAAFLTVLTFNSVLAQEPTNDFRLIAWRSDGNFWISTQSYRVVNSGKNQQQLTIWQTPIGSSSSTQLATGFDLTLAADKQALYYSSVIDNSRNSLNLVTGQITKVQTQQREVPPSHITDPRGRLFWDGKSQQRAILVNRNFRAELWLGERGEPAQLLLQTTGELFSDVSFQPDGQALIFIRTPLGSNTIAQSEAWHLDLATGLTQRLTYNQVEDRTPIWHPNGQKIALIQGGDIVIRTIDDPTPILTQSLFRPSAGLPLSSVKIMTHTQLLPPAAIRVVHHASNTCRDIPVGQIDTIPFETYVKRVVPHEVFPSWHPETLKAQAVAARTYSWYFIARNPTADYHVTDWVDFQYMCDETVGSTNAAVEATAGEYMAHNRQPILAFFSAENSSPTRHHTSLPYIKAVDDPPSFGQTRRGHGYGLGQHGAERWARQFQWAYQAILHHYYTDISLEEGQLVTASGVVTDAVVPNVAVTWPRNNHYLSSNTLWLKANTSDESGAISRTHIYLTTPLTTTRLISQVGSAKDGGYLIDIAAWPNYLPLTRSLVITAEAFDAAGQRGISPSVQVGIDRIVPTGLITTADFPQGTVIFTETTHLSPTLQISDTNPSDVLMALGDVGWQIEGETFAVDFGQIITDTAALNGQSLQATIATSNTWQIEREHWLPAGADYSAYFRLKLGYTEAISQNLLNEMNVISPMFTLSQTVATLNVFNGTSGNLIGLRYIRGYDFLTQGQYQSFKVDFHYPDHDPGVAFAVQFHGRANIAFDQMSVTTYPVTPQLMLNLNFDQTRLKLVDAAGNISNDLLIFFDFSSSHKLYLPLIMKILPD